MNNDVVAIEPDCHMEEYKNVWFYNHVLLKKIK
ncbi:MAG: hypothetical protein K0R54_3381 [Clostridiaceae bacterium]|jgi:hypothetical protein|nr:hypothetical protein [Clostridiaceae bacterium]